MNAAVLSILPVSSELEAVGVAMARVVLYLGFVLLVGTSFFLTWVWPEGRKVPIIGRLITVGAVVSIVGTVGTVLVTAPGWEGFTGRAGACAFARISLVCFAVAFAPNVLKSPRNLRWPVAVWQLAIIETYVLGSDAWGGSWQTVKILATTGHLAATAAWLGGLLTLASVLIPRSGLDVLHGVLPKFSVVALVSVIVLTITGVLHALAIAGSVSALWNSTYGTVLVVKVVVFAVMLLLGNIGRQYAAHASSRTVPDLDETSAPATVHAFAVAIGAEFALAIGVLVATAALVHAVPGT